MNIFQELRTEHRYTRKQLAKMFGVSTSTIYSIEVGRRNPGTKLLFKYANLFGVPLSDLLKD